MINPLGLRGNAAFALYNGGKEMSRPMVAVFGSGSCQPGQDMYEKAYDLGRLLALAGYDVMNGGYGGVMEATAKGVQESGVSEAKTTGVVMTHKPQGNQFLTTTAVAGDFFDRLRMLITKPTAHLVFPGETGTALELLTCLLWRKKFQSQAPGIIISKDDAEWDKIVKAVQDLTGQNLEMMASATSKPEIAIEILQRQLTI